MKLKPLKMKDKINNYEEALTWVQRNANGSLTELETFIHEDMIYELTEQGVICVTD
jgi:hypothetical protein